MLGYHRFGSNLYRRHFRRKTQFNALSRIPVNQSHDTANHLSVIIFGLTTRNNLSTIKMLTAYAVTSMMLPVSQLPFPITYNAATFTGSANANGTVNKMTDA